MASSNGTLSAFIARCGENPPVTSQKPVMRIFGVFFDLHLNKRSSKKETPVILDATVPMMTSF